MTWREYLNNDRLAQEQLRTSRALIEDATQDTLLWLQSDPSEEERVHVLAMQRQLADLDRIIARRIESRCSPKDGWEWAEGVHELFSLLEKAAEVRGNILGRGLARLPNYLPRELLGTRVRPVTKAPPPARDLRGTGGWTGNRSKLTQIPPDYPPHFPNELELRTAVIRSEAARKFPYQTQIFDLCGYFISEMSTHICNAVRAGEMRANQALSDSGMRGLIRSWLVYNCDHENERFPLEQEIRKCEQWRTLEKAVLAIAEAMRDASADIVESKPSDRREMVDAYIEEVQRQRSKRITRKDIWTTAGYRTRTEFERWERRDTKHPNQAADEIFTRILREKPHLT